MPVPDEFTLANEAAQFILTRTTLRPRIALVLGSGLGGFADTAPLDCMPARQRDDRAQSQRRRQAGDRQTGRDSSGGDAG